MDWRSVFRRRYQTAHNWIQDCSRPRRFSLAVDLSPQIWRQCYHAATGSVLMGVDVDNSRMSCFVRTDYTRRPQVGGAVTESQVHHLAATNAAVSEKQQLMQMSPRMTVMRVTATGATERMRVWYAGCATPREVVLPREKVEITQLAGRWAVLCSGRRAGDLRWLSVWDLVRGDMLMEWHARAPTVAHIMHADEDTAEVYEYQPSSTGPCTVAWKQWTLSTLDAVADSVCMGACTVLPPMTHSSLLNFSARRVGRAHSALLMRITHTNTVLVVHAHEENTMRGIPLETGERWSEITVCCRGFTLFSSKQYLFFAPDGTLRYRHTTRYNIHSLEPVLGNLYVAVIHDNIGTRHNHLLNISNGEVIRIIPDCYSLALPHISPVALFRIVQVQGELRMRDYGAD
ncbi:hypothetical protein THASP1DRAFT_29772 [Thamnocephalis sphaerospora]|uniref:Uncharacterized protein n=1 Tax=Thamnocephalis sphaerospora TaxID=78915 RepID=A0A4P9XQT6_9FUNG|nr:hypothetical protein THASP1DRAFT_29772 [Thamnocephalis sphaerospora]|eukprot:RKP08414.1 hypothetical protein THASP1DRAFT_29772 [Thamnocephalis sphaerospora]